MINRWSSFLADADNKEGVWQVIVLLALIGISLLTNLLAKIKQKQQEEQKRHMPPRTNKPPTPIASTRLGIGNLLFSYCVFAVSKTSF